MHCEISHSLLGILNYTALACKLLFNVINWKRNVSFESVKSFHSAFGLHLLFPTDGCWWWFIMATFWAVWPACLVLLTAFLGFLRGQVVHCLGLHPSGSLARLWFMSLCGANDFFKHTGSHCPVLAPGCCPHVSLVVIPQHRMLPQCGWILESSGKL